MRAVRILSESGKYRFMEYIQQEKSGSTDSPPIDELSEGIWSTDFPSLVMVETKNFSRRLELGKYLTDLFEGIDRMEVLDSPHMWSWLALFWFDQICPPSSGGARKVRETARYICSSDYTDYYRHLVAATWSIYDLYREDLSRLFLWSPLYEHNDFMEQLASIQYIITNRGFIEAADRLYWDAESGKPKRNSSNRKVPGNLRRLITIYKQLDLTYDLHSMSADEILTLLPSEFDRWENN